MRSDMKDVIIDTYRHKILARRGKTPNDPEQLDTGRVSMRRHVHLNGEMANFGDRIGPLRRFLRSRVGRKWDDVYKEVCEMADSRGIRGHHLREHLSYEVVIAKNGFDTSGTPLQPNGRTYWQYFYVLDGVLCESLRKPRSRGTKESKIIELNGKFYYKYEDIWYEVRKEPIVKEPIKVDYTTPVTRRLSYYASSTYFDKDDFHSESAVSARDFYHTYGEKVRLFKIKQCGKKICQKLNRKSFE